VEIFQYYFEIEGLCSWKLASQSDKKERNHTTFLGE